MARTPRGSNIPVVQKSVFQCNTEAREACGLKDRLIKDLSAAELQELQATYMLEGYDALKTKYGLTRGEIIELISSQGMQVLSRQAATAMRANTVMRLMHAMPRLTQMVETKAENAPLAGALEALKSVKEIFMDVSGLTPAQYAAPSDLAQMSVDEKDKVNELNLHLVALADAGLIADKPKNGTSNGNGNGHGSSVAA